MYFKYVTWQYIAYFVINVENRTTPSAEIHRADPAGKKLNVYKFQQRFAFETFSTR